MTKFSPLKSFQLVCRASDISGRFASCTPLTTELHHRLLTQEQHLHYLSSSSYDLSFSSFLSLLLHQKITLSIEMRHLIIPIQNHTSLQSIIPYYYIYTLHIRTMYTKRQKKGSTCPFPFFVCIFAHTRSFRS